MGFDELILSKGTSKKLKRKGINLGSSEKLKKNNVWKKNYFVICFFVSKFLKKLKSNLMSQKFKKLNHFHFDYIFDQSYIYKEINVVNLRDKLNVEYNKIIELSHSNQLKIKIKMLIFCNILL